jgi:hypothetical protein
LSLFLASIFIFVTGVFYFSESAAALPFSQEASFAPNPRIIFVDKQADDVHVPALARELAHDPIAYEWWRHDCLRRNKQPLRLAGRQCNFFIDDLAGILPLKTIVFRRSGFEKIKAISAIDYMSVSVSGIRHNKFYFNIVSVRNIVGAKTSSECAKIDAPDTYNWAMRRNKFGASEPKLKKCTDSQSDSCGSEDKGNDHEPKSVVSYSLIYAISLGIVAGVLIVAGSKQSAKAIIVAAFWSRVIVRYSNTLQPGQTALFGAKPRRGEVERAKVRGSDGGVFL